MSFQCTNCDSVFTGENCCACPDPVRVIGQRCRRDDIDRVNICTCEGCEMYRDQNYKLRVGRITRRDDERYAREYRANRERLTT
jgi:hypothetical protein